jgi:type II secretion system protein H
MLRTKHTSSFIFAHFWREGCPSSTRFRRPLISKRGFTLIEMMVVVVVITLSAAIAMPGIAKRMKTNRAKMAAEKIATIYRTARLRALGRGSAVLVRYNNGVFSTREGIQGVDRTATGCEPLPEPSCLLPSTRWDNTSRSQSIETVDFVSSGDFTVSAQTTAVVTSLDICFSPSGRSFSRTVTTATLADMSAPVRFDLSRTDGVGVKRAIVVSPAGTARTVAE